MGKLLNKDDKLNIAFHRKLKVKCINSSDHTFVLSPVFDLTFNAMCSTCDKSIMFTMVDIISSDYDDLKLMEP